MKFKKIKHIKSHTTPVLPVKFELINCLITKASIGRLLLQMVNERIPPVHCITWLHGPLYLANERPILHGCLVHTILLYCTVPHTHTAQVPQFDGLVITGWAQQPAVVRPRDVAHSFRVATQRTGDLGVVRGPDINQLIGGCGRMQVLSYFFNFFNQCL